MRKRAISSSFSHYNGACPASERYGAAAHTGYSRAALAGDSNTKPRKPLCQLLSAWKTIPRISRWLLCIRVWVCPSTTLFQRRGAVSNIASKRAGSEKRGKQSAQKRSDRESPSERAGVRVLQPLFRNTQKRRGAPPDSRYQTLNRALCKHPFLRFAFEGTAYQYVLLFGLALAPLNFSKCMNAALSPLRASGMHILNYLDYWLILAQSRDSLLLHLESLGLCVNMQKSILAPSQSITGILKSGPFLQSLAIALIKHT